MKKLYYLVFILFLFSACIDKKTPTKIIKRNLIEKKNVPLFQEIIDSSDVVGSILIFDLKKYKYYSNDYQWAEKGKLPASTFKIVNSIIALETNVIESDSTIIKWDGTPRYMESWEQDLTLRDAFHYSCVPCYQEIAREIGVTQMNQYLTKLEYGDMVVDSSNIDLFWLQGKSSISPFQQINFLKRFYRSYMPITDRTRAIMKRMMVKEVNDNYKLSGKTGWSIYNDINNAWFVGYLETNENVYLFATNIEPNGKFDRNKFLKARKEITLKAINALQLMK